MVILAPMTLNAQTTIEFTIEDAPNLEFALLKAQTVSNRIIRDLAYLTFSPNQNVKLQKCWENFIVNKAVEINISERHLQKVRGVKHTFQLTFDPHKLTVSGVKIEDFKRVCM